MGFSGRPSASNKMPFYDGTKWVHHDSSRPLSAVLYVDGSTSTPSGEQDGSLEAPFSTITTALGSNTTLQILAGDYTAEGDIDLTTGTLLGFPDGLTVAGPGTFSPAVGLTGINGTLGVTYFIHNCSFKTFTGVAASGLIASRCILQDITAGDVDLYRCTLAVFDANPTVTLGAVGGSFNAEDCDLQTAHISCEGTASFLYNCNVDVGFSFTFTGAAGVLTVDPYTGARLAAIGFVAPTNGTLTVLTPPTTERIPTQMIFTEVFKQAWFDGVTLSRILPTATKWVDDPFTDTTQTRFTRITESNTGSLTITGGQAQLVHSSGADHQDSIVEGVAIGMPQVMMTVDLISRSGSNGAYSAILLGLVKDGSNYICINWNIIANAFQIQTKVAGVNHFDGNVSTSGWASPPTTIGFSIVGNWVTTYAIVSNVWTKVTSFDVSAYIDFKAQDHTLWYPMFGAATPTTVTNTYVFDNFRVGRFGGVGMRDMCVVTNEDGSPYYSSPTVVKALATLAGASGGISEASMGIFDIDLEQKTFTMLGVIMVNRGSKVQNDHAGHMIREANGDQHLTVSTWGDTPTATRIVYKFVAAATDLFVGSHVVSSVATLSLTELPASGGQYDPFLIKKGSTWYLAYTATPTAPNAFYPALDSSTDLTSWTNVGKDTTAIQFEGTRILPFNGQSFVLTGGPFFMKMYSLAMTYIGIVNCISPGSGGTQPHAMIFPYNGLDLLVTFDETKWPTSGGLAFSWGSIRWFASPRY